MRTIAGVCLAALSLAACNGPADKPDSAVKSVAEAPVPEGIDAAPRLKAGLWEMTATVNGKTESLRTCVDPAIQGDSAIPGQSLDRRNCSRSEWSAMPGGVAFDLICANGDQTIASVGVITGDFQSAYHFEADATMTQGSATHSGHQAFDAKLVGECPAGLKPGQKMRQVAGRWEMLPG